MYYSEVLLRIFLVFFLGRRKRRKRGVPASSIDFCHRPKRALKIRRMGKVGARGHARARARGSGKAGGGEKGGAFAKSAMTRKTRGKRARERDEPSATRPRPRGPEA
jgi:hypothetical protein